MTNLEEALLAEKRAITRVAALEKDLEEANAAYGSALNDFIEARNARIQVEQALKEEK